MTGDVQGLIADWLHRRGIEDDDGFGKRVAAALASADNWDAGGIGKVLESTKTNLFKRNAGLRKSKVCRELTQKILARCKALGKVAVPATGKCKILFFAANPAATSQLNLAEEVRAITEKIRAAKHRDTVELITAWAARPDDLLQYLNEHDATIVHFSAHGSGASGLVLQGHSANPAFVDADALRALFKSLKGKVRLVVLNACDSLGQARAISEVIDCVVGMRVPIGDEAARVFAASLYRAIGFGCSVKDAFDQGKVALKLEGITESDTPVLLCRRGVRPSKVFLTPR